MPEIDGDREIVLTHGFHRARVSTLGASLRAYAFEGRELVWGYSGGLANKRGGQGDVLIPFPGRVRGGAYALGGVQYQMKKNDKDGPNAIHGFVRLREWAVVSESPSACAFTTSLNADEFDGYPFMLSLRLDYRLSDQGLECSFEAENTGTQAAPFGAGFHPYFLGAGAVSADDMTVELPATTSVEFGADLLPTGRLLDFRDWRKPRRVGATVFNHCLTGLERGPDGLARARVLGPEGGAEIWWDEAFPYVVVYTGDTIPAPHARRAFAIEPMTCATDAFNQGAYEHDCGLRVLLPGHRVSGRWGAQPAKL